MSTKLIVPHQYENSALNCHQWIQVQAKQKNISNNKYFTVYVIKCVI